MIGTALSMHFLNSFKSMTQKLDHGFKILHIAPHYGGGVGAVVFDLVAELRSNYGSQSTMVAIDVAKTKPSINSSTNSKSFIDRILSNYEKLASLVSSHDVTIVHYWNHPLLACLLAAFKFPPTNLAFWVHSVGLHQPNIIPHCLFHPQVKVLLSSSAASQSLPTISKLNPENIEVIHSTRDLSRFLAESRIGTKDKSQRRVTCIGTISRQKLHEGTHIIFKAIASQGIHIDIVGEVTDAYLLESLSSAPNIFFHGFQADTLPFLRGADCFIYPLNSKHYGTGEQVILEAMAVGVPPVCMDNPSERQIIRHLDNGILCSDVNGFISSTLELLDNPVEIKRLGLNARKSVIERFSISESASRFQRIFIDFRQQATEGFSGQIMSINPHDIPFGAMLSSSLLDQGALKLYQQGDYRASVESARECFTSFMDNADIMRLPSKGSPFQYLHYFPSSNLIQELCSSL